MMCRILFDQDEKFRQCAPNTVYATPCDAHFLARLLLAIGGAIPHLLRVPRVIIAYLWHECYWLSCWHATIQLVNGQPGGSQMDSQPARQRQASQPAARSQQPKGSSQQSAPSTQPAGTQSGSKPASQPALRQPHIDTSPTP